MSLRVFFVVLIALGSWLTAGCESSSSLAAEPGSAAPRPIAQASPAVTRTPSGIFYSTSIRPTTMAVVATVAAGDDVNAVIVQGRVYDAGQGQRMNDATLEWQFLSPDWQRYDGQLRVPTDGLFRLQLPIRSEDEVIITARAPGYLPSTARLLGRQLNRYGSHLNFGLVKADGPVPTLPGALGTIQLSGIVYNSARGLRDPIANACVTIFDRSLVSPETQVTTTTSITGSFVMPVALHRTDLLDVTISASGYQTATLTRSATDLAAMPQLAIGLKAAPIP